MVDTGKPPVPSPADLRERLISLREDLERLRLDTETRWTEMVSRLAERSREILQEAAPDAEAPPTAPTGAVSIDSVRRLDSASGQVEVLTRLLEECLQHASRAVLLVERRGGVEPWKSVGFRTSPEKGKSLPRTVLLDRVREGRPQRLGAGNEISLALGSDEGGAAILLPFVVREKVSGALYADAVDGEEARFDERALALLAYVAAAALDRLAKRKLVPSPPLRQPEDGAELPAAENEPPTFAATPPPESPAAPLPDRPLAGPLAPSAGNERREEARLFARLLATEIKLYNEEAIVEGLARGNLSDRLKDEIERGRRLYEERVPADVRSETDYYREELIEVLAGGRPEFLRV